jgi:hypothetical protein
LKIIKNTNSQYGRSLSKDAGTSPAMEIDSLNSQMIGTFDCLIFSIIDKFRLYSIPNARIELDKVFSVLSAESQRIDLAKGVRIIHC